MKWRRMHVTPSLRRWFYLRRGWSPLRSSSKLHIVVFRSYKISQTKTTLAPRSSLLSFLFQQTHTLRLIDSFPPIRWYGYRCRNMSKRPSVKCYNPHIQKLSGWIKEKRMANERHATFQSLHVTLFFLDIIKEPHRFFFIFLSLPFLHI